MRRSDVQQQARIDRHVMVAIAHQEQLYAANFRLRSRPPGNDSIVVDAIRARRLESVVRQEPDAAHAIRRLPVANCANVRTGNGRILHCLQMLRPTPWRVQLIECSQHLSRVEDDLLDRLSERRRQATGIRRFRGYGFLPEIPAYGRKQRRRAQEQGKRGCEQDFSTAAHGRARSETRFRSKGCVRPTVEAARWVTPEPGTRNEVPARHRSPPAYQVGGA